LLQYQHEYIHASQFLLGLANKELQEYGAYYWTYLVLYENYRSLSSIYYNEAMDYLGFRYIFSNRYHTYRIWEWVKDLGIPITPIPINL
jgi:hypothetical protein